MPIRHPLSWSIGLALTLAISGCHDSKPNTDTTTPPDNTCTPTSYTYDFNCDTTVPADLTLNASETSDLTASAALETTDGADGNALALTVSGNAGEKKLYLVAGARTSLTKISYQVKISQEAFDAGFTGAKLYAKTGDNWTWNAGDWVSINPDTWTTVTWTPGTNAIDLSDIKELGLQFYAGSDSAAAQNVKLYVDDILIQ